MSAPKWNLGSCWLRWDPHVHAPGTLLNDNFRNDWGGYLAKLESAAPAVAALGITDYHTLRGYKEVRHRCSQSGRLATVLVFPNVELRLTIETRARSAINLHLLVSPDDPQHVERIEEHLGRLEFRYDDHVYYCTDDSLQRLGRASEGRILDDGAALRAGANQFKVELGALRQAFEKDAWLRGNVLVAVAAGEDGLGGLAGDGAFKAQREELGRFADIVFSGQPNQRKFWLGDHPNFAAERQTPKPCLHGSDAHDLARVLEPNEQRRCWIRGAATFESLRQTLLEPERRVHIGESPVAGASDAEVIREIVIGGAAWVENQSLPLNDGLVAIIGARGSGKTALADLIAAAAGAADPVPGEASFVRKAADKLDGLHVTLRWADGSSTRASFPSEFADVEEPHARYLSQQFVERLCAADQFDDALVEEIERVVFEAIPEEDRLFCASFDELRRERLADPTAQRETDRAAIRERTRQIATEHALQKDLPKRRAEATEAERKRKSLEGEIAKIPVPAGDEKAKALQQVASRHQQLAQAVQEAERRAKRIADLREEIQRQLRLADDAIAEMRLRYADVVDEAAWEKLQLRIDQGGITALNQAEAAWRTTSDNLRKTGSAIPGGEQSNGLGALKAEHERLKGELGMTATNQKRRTELEQKLAKVLTDETRIAEAIKWATKSGERQQQAVGERLALYSSVFAALTAEEAALADLYTPLRARLGNSDQLKKLAFNVRREVDLAGWVKRGESLLDLRRTTQRLEEAAKTDLFQAWKTGSADDARAAMERFLANYALKANDARAHGVTPEQFGEWLFSTDHIRVRYGIQYEGVELANLSPGTRGVVLLTLYLALDETDTRPLIIDQPEENLDPRTVFADLVPFFRTAARRRQIIMVTHNANLVVNTDADQVIVAEATRTAPSGLPLFRYQAGGLEDEYVRTEVCSVLEGGAEAFRKRARRYREER